MTTWEVHANRLLAAQEQVISAAQVCRCGASRNAAHAKVRRGAWVAMAPGVYCPAGMQGGWLQRLWIACLAIGPGAVLSHDSAAQLQGLPPANYDAVTLSVPLGRHPRVAGARISEVADLGAPHITRRLGLPVTTPARTIVDLAGRRDVSVARLDDLIKVAHRSRVALVEDVATVAGHVRRRGKPGMAKLDEVFEKRAPGDPVPASVLEELLFDVIGLAGLGSRVVYQYPLPTDIPLVGFVDAAFPEAKLIVEADGRRWHSQEQDMERDRDRDNGAAARGWQTMRVMYRRMKPDPDGIAQQVRMAFDERVRPAVRA
jgi:hypothetical protein